MMRKIVALCFGLMSAVDAGEHQQAKPNILFAIADDWGWPQSHMVKDIQCTTPTFYRLSKEGVRFKHAYATAPSCSPSRAGILSGQHAFRLNEGANLHGSIRIEVPLYTNLLAKAGYSVGSMRKGWGPGKIPGREHNPAGVSYRDFGQFLEKHDKSKPFCFWFGAWDPHRGYKKGSGASGGVDVDKLKLPGCFPDSEEVRGDVADYYHEVKRFDREFAVAIDLLRKQGLLENTIVVMTSDHGMPFPRAKSTLYDQGSRVPLAIRWGNKLPKENCGKVIDGFVNLIDLAPTFLKAAGVKVPEEMTGSDLLPLMLGKPVVDRSFVITAKERHVPCQESPETGGTPARAIRDKKYLLIQNFAPNRWPVGTPHYEKSTIKNCWYGDVDNGPTKSYMVKNKDRDEHHRNLYSLAFGKRPSLELYDCDKDPHQLVNLADKPPYKILVKKMNTKLHEELTRLEDPRMEGKGEKFDKYPYSGNAPKFPGAMKSK